jgi:hypothetical protein
MEDTAMIHDTAYRVAEHTSGGANERIRRETEARVAAYAEAGPDRLDERLRELDEEWDIERALETNGSTLLLAGLALGVFANRRWLAVPALVGGFCLQHALQGWCPPIEVFRRLGIRTAREIEEERTALKALRGDFAGLPTGQAPGPHAAQVLLDAARR